MGTSRGQFVPSMGVPGGWAELGSSPAAVGRRVPGQVKVRKMNPLNEYLGIQFISTGETTTEDFRWLAWLKIMGTSEEAAGPVILSWLSLGQDIKNEFISSEGW